MWITPSPKKQKAPRIRLGPEMTRGRPSSEGSSFFRQRRKLVRSKTVLFSSKTTSTPYASGDCRGFTLARFWNPSEPAYLDGHYLAGIAMSVRHVTIFDRRLPPSCASLLFSGLGRSGVSEMYLLSDQPGAVALPRTFRYRVPPDAFFISLPRIRWRCRCRCFYQSRAGLKAGFLGIGCSVTYRTRSRIPIPLGGSNPQKNEDTLFLKVQFCIYRPGG